MLKKEIIEIYYANGRTRNVPIVYTMECLEAFFEALQKVKEENPYATISELFDE